MEQDFSMKRSIEELVAMRSTERSRLKHISADEVFPLLAPIFSEKHDAHGTRLKHLEERFKAVE